MKIIKIARIVTGVAENEDGQVFAPYAIVKHDFDHWYLFKQAEKLFDKITWKNFAHEDSNGCDGSDNPEMDLLHAVNNGYKPHLWLHSFEMPQQDWKNKKRLAAADGYDDVDRWLTEIYTHYRWKYEKCREVPLSEEHQKMFDVFAWCEKNRASLTLNYANFIGETGSDLTQKEFDFFMADSARDIIEPTLN